METTLCLLAFLALQAPESADAARGLRTRTPEATPGYVLIAPLRSSSTYLVGTDGNVAHEWKSDAPPGQAVYLEENGKLLRTERVDNPRFQGGGQGGRIRELDWDGNVTWEYVLSDDKQCLHHDVKLLPDGHVLAIVWEQRSRDELVAVGRDAATARDGLWCDALIEIEPIRPKGGNIVWEWHAFDHLVQAREPAKPDYVSDVSQRPERIDVSAAGGFGPGNDAERRRERGRLQRLGYVGGDDENPPRIAAPDAQDGPRGGGRDGQGRPGGNGDGNGGRPGGQGRPGGPGGRGPMGGPPVGESDWTHVNGIDWRADLDLIVVSVHNLSELWVIDHSTTTAEARTSSGGRFGHGGDLLFRYGNPRAYGATGAQTLFVQHDPQWLANGHVLVFNNGGDGSGNSSADEIDLGISAESLAKGFDPARLADAKRVWTYTSPDIRSSHISGVQRLANGHTLISAGEPGLVREVDADGKVVWDYASPLKGDMGPRGPMGRRPDGDTNGPRDGAGPNGPPGGDGPFPPRDGNGPDSTGPDRGGMGPRGGRGGRGGMDGPYGLFRADHYAADFPGLRALSPSTGTNR